MGLVIIGSGMASQTCVREYRACFPDRSITLVTKDDGFFYSKPMLSQSFELKKNPDKLIMQSAEVLANRYQVDIQARQDICHIDAKEKYIESTSGQSWRYDQLVLAVGASPKPFSSIANQKGVFSINHYQDYQRFRAYLKSGMTVGIIGAGLVGTEFAHDLATSGYAVTLCSDQAAPLTGLLPAKMSHQLLASLSSQGVKFKCNAKINKVEEKDGQVHVTDSSSDWHCDVLITAIGIAPNLQLANDLSMKTDRGILVKDGMQTSVPHIFALGDCVQVHDKVLPYIAPIRHQVKNFINYLNGNFQSLDYPLMPIKVKTSTYPLLILPPNTDNGRWEAISDTQYHYLSNQQDTMLGFALAQDKVKLGPTLIKAMQVR
jgi:rubredoxin-NAD+ reductase